MWVFAHFLVVSVELAETPLLEHFNIFAVWAVWLELKYIKQGGEATKDQVKELD